jgi:hypothetical protein
MCGGEQSAGGNYVGGIITGSSGPLLSVRAGLPGRRVCRRADPGRTRSPKGSRSPASTGALHWTGGPSFLCHADGSSAHTPLAIDGMLVCRWAERCHKSTPQHSREAWGLVRSAQGLALLAFDITQAVPRPGAAWTKIASQRGYWGKSSFLRLHGLPLPDHPK